MINVYFDTSIDHTDPDNKKETITLLTDDDNFFDASFGLSGIDIEMSYKSGTETHKATIEAESDKIDSYLKSWIDNIITADSNKIIRFIGNFSTEGFIKLMNLLKGPRNIPVITLYHDIANEIIDKLGLDSFYMPSDELMKSLDLYPYMKYPSDGLKSVHDIRSIYTVI